MYQLMCKDTVLAEFDFIQDGDYRVYANLRVIKGLPIGYNEDLFEYWLEDRHAVKHRQHLEDYLTSIGCSDLENYLKLTNGTSINDCYWVRESTNGKCWSEVSLYTNEFSDTIRDLAFCGAGIPIGAFSSTTPEFGTKGFADKCWIKEDDGIYLLKRGTTGYSNAGMEPYCEVLASQVFTAMKAGIPYELTKFHNIVSSKCKLFTSEDAAFIEYALLSKTKAFPRILSYYDALGSDIFRRIVICDAIVFNVDRHSHNHGVLYDPDTSKAINIAPGFDYNLSLFNNFLWEDFINFEQSYFKSKPRIGDTFLKAARMALTPEIRKDLLNIRGIQLKLPFYDDLCSKERCDWLTRVVNAQIDNILSDGDPVIPKFDYEMETNCGKYRQKNNIHQAVWVETVPQLMQQLNIRSMTELEQEIVKLL